jgi:uncharacterized protein YegP (UPF0339 family)
MASSAKFEVFRDSKGEYRWHLRSANNHIIATSGEGYLSEQHCRDGIAAVQKDAPQAPVTAVVR